MSVTLTGSLNACSFCLTFSFFFPVRKKKIWYLEIFMAMINQWNQGVTFAHRKKRVTLLLCGVGVPWKM